MNTDLFYLIPCLSQLWPYLVHRASSATLNYISPWFSMAINNFGWSQAHLDFQACSWIDLASPSNIHSSWMRPRKPDWNSSEGEQTLPALPSLTSLIFFFQHTSLWSCSLHDPWYFVKHSLQTPHCRGKCQRHFFSPIQIANSSSLDNSGLKLR